MHAWVYIGACNARMGPYRCLQCTHGHMLLAMHAWAYAACNTCTHGHMLLAMHAWAYIGAWITRSAFFSDRSIVRKQWLYQYQARSRWQSQPQLPHFFSKEKASRHVKDSSGWLVHTEGFLRLW